ncbi:Isobutyryl-CoA dehydrogenase [Sarcoptes scabiei]|uniref:Isobutyryl-CoA dehydrogenase, mitochondrial n=1 Tax=Sarcoptes scabiei TaxID=52283 RepID=A0A132ADY1_SARSC|nr:Isobutyryl-CoA dehydrogenase [Sarcoptes scabiei]KPM09184.1 isobutyryl-CoA dehydrogenase, mitochondrial-like protein [Sarcoptes scabiei]
MIRNSSFIARNCLKANPWNTIGSSGLKRISSLRGTIIDPAFDLNDDEKQLQETAYQFALKEFRPRMREWDQNEHFPREEIKKCADLGFGGIYVPIEDGGSGLSRLETSIVFEALSQGCVSTTALITIHNMCSYILSHFGCDQLKKRYLKDIVEFNKMASYCLTEPGAGSDAGNLQTTAVEKDDHYILNGSKAFISGGGDSDVYFVMCRTGEKGPKGISCMILEKGFKGLSFGKKESKLGWNSQPTRAVIMEDCVVPKENLVGELNQGFKIAMEALNGGRINVSSCSLGAAQWAMNAAIEYTMDRKQFQKSILSFQNTQFKLASMAAELLASRLIVRAAARNLDNLVNKVDTENVYPVPSLVAAGKLIATEKAYQIIDQCLQLFGGYGYLKDYPVQQLLRDSRVHRILEGTNEIMQLIIARDFQKLH